MDFSCHSTNIAFCLHGFECNFMTRRSHSDTSVAGILKTTVVLWDLRIRLSKKQNIFSQMTLGTSPNTGKPDPAHMQACPLSNPQASSTPSYYWHKATSPNETSLLGTGSKSHSDRSVHSIIPSSGLQRQSLWLQLSALPSSLVARDNATGEQLTNSILVYNSNFTYLFGWLFILFTSFN